MTMKMNGYTEGRTKKNTSPNTQWKNFSQRAMKTYGNTESRAKHKKDSSEPMNGNLKVVTKSQHTADKLWSEGCKDERQSLWSC